MLEYINSLSATDKGIVVTIIVLIVMLILYVTGKKNLVKSIVVDYINHIEDLYLNGGIEADERLEEVLGRVREVLPFYLKPLATKKVVQKIFDEIKERLDYKKVVVNSKKVEGAKDIIGQAIDVDWNGDKSIISNSQLNELGEKYQGYVEGYGKYSVDDGAEIGLQAGVKW